MDPIVSADDPTLSQAMAALASDDSLESTPNPEPAPESPTPAQTGPEPGAATVPDASPQPDGAPATQETAIDKKLSDEKTVEPKGYEKNRVRLEGGWKELNARKAEFHALNDALKRDRERLESDRQILARKQAQAAKPRFTPETYEQHAGALDARAAALKREADALEAAGRFESAEAKNEEAVAERVNARKAREYAAQLRAHPPAPDQAEVESQKQYEEKLKEWSTKAAIDFPNTAKKDSPEGKTLAAALTPGAEGFDSGAHQFVNDHPEGIYYLAKLVSAQTSAARVPALEKELAELRAKVKEYTEKLAPTAEAAHGKTQAPVSFEQSSSQEQEQQLVQMANTLDANGGL